jgi:hypothetical protein
LDVRVEEVDGDFLRVVAERLKMNVRMLAGRAAEHCARQIRVKRCEPLHPFDGDAAQAPQKRRLAVALEQRLILADFFFDLIVIRQPFAGNPAFPNDLPGRFALGRRIVETVFGDQARSRNGDFLAHALRIKM